LTFKLNFICLPAIGRKGRLALRAGADGVDESLPQKMSRNQNPPANSDETADRQGLARATTFRLLSDEHAIVANGVRREMPRGPAATLPDRAVRFLAELTDGPQVLVGAMPFDRSADDFLFQPDAILFDAKVGPGARILPRRPSRRHSSRWLVAPEPSPAAYSEAVRQCLERLAHPQELGKVVLSRSLLVTADRPIDVDALVASLAEDPSVTTFLTRLPADGETPRALAGATPELLVSKSGGEVISHPLAGSARRHADPAADWTVAAALERSEKDQREHRAVVEAVLDTLSPYCSTLSKPDSHALRATATMWHLSTRIVGRLKDENTPVVELAAALHPTPAVCGLPRDRAAAAIRALEPYERGFYAGAIGWTDGNGDGSWYVSLRCAEIAGSRARLYAGAGIVLGSDPVAEADETSGKFLAMLKALGVDEQGRPLDERAA
jgi:isochorismate synthase